MAKRTRVIATYRINQHEVIQAQVDAESSYPEAIAVARANARELVAEILSDVMAQPRVDIEDGE